jgi:xanthine dehydrogenase small subunit
MPPALIAVDARVVLRREDRHRTIPVDTFFRGYRTTALEPGEFIEAIELPRPPSALLFRVYKISKRIEQDVSAVCAAFAMTVDNGFIQSCRIGLGGMATTPVRARRTEAALVGQRWCEATIRDGMTILAAEFQPISDMRASAAYRSKVVGNLLLRFFLETSGTSTQARLGAHA